MTTVNVVLTPGVDTDQTDSAQAQISAAPDGTLANPTIINMPAGRYRIDGASGFGGLRLINRNHIRWTCLAGVETYPNAPTDAQAFVAYTNLSAIDAGFSARHHFMIKGCTNVVGSFLRIDGPDTRRNATYPLYALYVPGKAAEHAFSIYGGCVDCGWEDCSYNNVYGDGIYVGFQGTPNTNAHVYRHTGAYAGRMSFSLTNVVGFTGIDITGDYAGFAGFDIEPNNEFDHVDDAYMEQIHMGSRFYPYTFQGGSPTRPSKGSITLKDSSIIRCAVPGHLALITSQQANDLVIDNLQDFRNRNYIGMQISGPWNNVTVKNCIVRTGDNASTSYAVDVHALESYTSTGNTFKGYAGTEGFDNLTLFNAVTPPLYVHYGNTWGPAGVLNDGAGPPPGSGIGAVTAAKPSVHGTGSASALAVGAVEAAPPSVSGIGSATFVSQVDPLPNTQGPPFRVRGRRPSRVRGVAGATIRGEGGVPDPHPFRIRPETGVSRIRSESAPSYVRAGEQGLDLTGTGAVTAAAPSVAGLGATADINGIGTVTAAAPSVAGAGTETITGVGDVTAAIPTIVGSGELSNQSTGAVTAAMPSVAGVGSVSALGLGSVVAAAPSVSGVGVESIEGTGAVLAAKPSVAGVAFMPLMTGTGEVTAEAPSVAGVGSVTDIDISVVEVWYLPPVILGHRAPHYLRRFDQIGIPRSPKYRQFLRNYVDAGEVVGDTPEGDNIYGFVGGRWNGPLTQEQVDIITAAGQESRMITVHSINELPPDLESDYAGAVSEGGYGHDYGHDYGH